MLSFLITLLMTLKLSCLSHTSNRTGGKEVKDAGQQERAGNEVASVSAGAASSGTSHASSIPDAAQEPDSRNAVDVDVESDKDPASQPHLDM
jgi:hypothetical protein